MLQRARDIWRETPPLTRTLCKVMPTLGSLLTLLGVFGDSRGWWDNKSFLTNLVSSFTGLMFAVPFALVVVSRLGEAHAFLAEQRAVQRHSERVLRDFQAAWSDMDRTIERVLVLAASQGNPDLRDSRSMPPEFWMSLENALNFVGQERLRAMKAQWRSLRDEVRPRRLEVESRWDFDQMLVFEEHFADFCEVYARMSTEAKQACDSPRTANYPALREDFQELTGSAIATWRPMEGEYPTFGIPRP
ncbi:hypothetical protein [Streptomyces sp. NBC_00989]|uniref:hypothetical protein n=1 Tax=Streptomyces sp. NBC_00989 TaxID=2903705 RepID=UPI0038653222|nr:hypothetical protein OG714_34260 [Streptomyces sp. NBC_00989]